MKAWLEQWASSTESASGAVDEGPSTKSKEDAELSIDGESAVESGSVSVHHSKYAAAG